MRKFIKNTLLNIRAILTPKCWLRNYRHCAELDKFILDAIESKSFGKFDDYYVEVFGVDVWIENYPYAYGTIRNNKSLGMPSRKVVFQLKKAVDEHITQTLFGVKYKEIAHAEN